MQIQFLPNYHIQLKRRTFYLKTNDIRHFHFLHALKLAKARQLIPIYARVKGTGIVPLMRMQVEA